MSYTIEKHEYSDIIQDLFVLQNHENKICLKSDREGSLELQLIDPRKVIGNMATAK